MILGRVVGNVVATQKNDRYEGSRVLVVEPIDLEGARSGAELLALDAVDAGPGDVVLVVREGWGASTAATGRPQAAIDSAIVAVVDHVDVDKV
jgi:ethanolamine utilization protein EutN